MKNTFIVLRCHVACWFRKKFDRLDRWLCNHAFRAFRWRWRLAWQRTDVLHPSYHKDLDHLNWLTSHHNTEEFETYLHQYFAHWKLAHKDDVPTVCAPLDSEEDLSNNCTT